MTSSSRLELVADCSPKLGIFLWSEVLGFVLSLHLMMMFLLGCSAAKPPAPASSGMQECPTRGGDMVVVPAGEFLFGERARRVILPTFCIDRTEVSAAAYRECIQAGGCDSHGTWERCATISKGTPHQCHPERSDYPANYINRYRAVQFCAWAGKRLPTEFEWEKAARGTDGRIYPWGNTIDCSHAHHSRGNTFEACRKYGGLPDTAVPVDWYAHIYSPYGAINLIGNMREWVLQGGQHTTRGGGNRVGISKGGSWTEGEWLLTAFERETLLSPDLASSEHGFRCAANPRQ